MLKESQKSKPEKRSIDIYTLSGKPISSIPVSGLVLSVDALYVT